MKLGEGYRHHDLSTDGSRVEIETDHENENSVRIFNI